VHGEYRSIKGGGRMKDKYCSILDLKEIEESIEESIRRSEKTNKEHGFNFCSDNGRIIITEIEEGGKNSLGIESKCPKESEIIGGLHIHTRPVRNDAIPSPVDIAKGITDEDITFFCVGAIIGKSVGDGDHVGDHNIIRCFAKDDLEKEMKDIGMIDGFIKLGFDKDIQKTSKLISSTMKIKKDYLNKLSCRKDIKKQRK
jgi:hypothetical protein